MAFISMNYLQGIKIRSSIHSVMKVDCPTQFVSGNVSLCLSISSFTDHLSNKDLRRLVYHECHASITARTSKRLNRDIQRHVSEQLPTYCITEYTRLPCCSLAIISINFPKAAVVKHLPGCLGRNRYLITALGGTQLTPIIAQVRATSTAQGIPHAATCHCRALSVGVSRPMSTASDPSRSVGSR